MTGGVNIRQTVIYDLCSFFEKLVDHAVDRVFIAGNRGGRNDNLISGADLDLLVSGECHAVKRRHGFPLTSRRNDDSFVFGMTV